MTNQSHVTNAPFDAYEGDEPYIFISYKHSDWKVVYPIIKSLYDAGFNIWYDAALTKGKNYDIQIANHIQNSSLFITFMTKTVIESSSDDEDYLVKELTVANSTGRKRLPIFLDDVELTGFYLMHYAGKQSILKYEYEDNENLFIKECIRTFREDFGIEPKIQMEDERLNTVDLKLFDKLNSTTESIFDLEGHDVLIVLKDGTNLTNWEDVKNKEDIIYISEDLTNCSNLNKKYAGLISLKAIVLSKISDEVTDMSYMFYDCSSLKDIIGLKNEDDSQPIEMNAMFYGCSSLKDINALNKWNVGKVVNMNEMFFGCLDLNDISALKDWNTENVVSMSKMFYRCSSLKDINALQNWNTGKLTDMSIMFYGCSGLVDVSALRNWDTGQVTDMSIMFYDCYSLRDVKGLEKWNTENVTNMDWLFYRCSGLVDVSALRNWDTGRVTGMSKMFYGCSGLVDVSALQNWDTGQVTDMSDIFYGCSDLDEVSLLQNWNKPKHAGTIDYGIDLGNHRSYIAKVDGDTTVIVPNKTDNRNYVASAVYIKKNGVVLVGDRAKNKIATDPKNGYMEFRSRMGSNHFYEFEKSGLQMTPVELSAEILKNLRATVKQMYQKDLQAAVITVPADFTAPQTQATTEAAKLAGFKEVILLQEPTAAAMAYGFGSSEDNEIWLIYNLGGGTFDVSVMQKSEDEIKNINNQGDAYLGGKLIDWDIVDKIFAPVIADELDLVDFNRDNEKYIKQFAKLKKAAEVAKTDLSTFDSAEVEIENFFISADGDVYDFEYDMTREELEDVMKPYVDRTINHCHKALEGADLSISDVTKIILVGDSTSDSYLHKRLSEEFNIHIEDSIDPTTVFVRGAAIYAGTKPLHIN